MALDGLRKVVTIVEDVEREGGEPVVPATRMVAAGAVVENPFAGRYVADLEPLIERFCEPLGELLTARALALLGGPAEGVGKGALVGLDGDLEHGSAVIHNGVLLPNTEFGHLEVGGKEAEHRAASSVKERKEWTYERWTREVTKVLVAIENAIWPDLFIAGGGISRKADKWIPLLQNRVPVVAATLQNTAGIVGAAMAAEFDVTATGK